MLIYAPYLHAHPGSLQWNADTSHRSEYRAFQDPIIKTSSRARAHGRQSRFSVVAFLLLQRFAEIGHIAKSSLKRDDKVSNAHRVPSKPTGFQSFSLHVYDFIRLWLADHAYPRDSQVARGLRDPWPAVRFREVVWSQFPRTSVLPFRTVPRPKIFREKNAETDTKKEMQVAMRQWLDCIDDRN